MSARGYLVALGLAACGCSLPNRSPQDQSHQPAQLRTTGRVLVTVLASGSMAQRLSLVLRDGIRRLGDIELVEDVEADDSRDWTVHVTAMCIEETDAFHSKWALSVDVTSHTAIVPFLNSLPADLRTPHEYVWADFGVLEASWIQFCTNEPADTDSLEFIQTLNSRVFQRRRDMANEDLLLIQRQWDEVRARGWN